VPGLNENHKRRLVAAFEHADELLNRSLEAVTPSRTGQFSRYIHDMSSSDLHWVESYVDKIRDQIYSLMQRFQVEVPSPSIASSWALKTGLISLDIALEDLYPEKMKGYGAIDETTASELTWTLQEIRRLLNQLFAFLTDTGTAQEKRILQLKAEPSLVSMLHQFAQIIARHQLVKFLPTLNSITRKIESHRYEIAVFGRVSSGKSSLVNELLGIQLLPVGTTPITAVPIHIVAGPQPRLRVTFLDRTVATRAEALPEFAAEQFNPANSKGVVALELSVPSKRVQDGVAFVDTPGIASLATTGTKLAYAYLPDCDFALVLVDSQSTLGRDDLDILRALHTSGIPSAVLITKCDLLSPADIERTVAYTLSEIVGHLGLHLDVFPVSSKEPWAPEVNRWFDATMLPLLERARESLNISTNRKLQSLRKSILATLESKARRAIAPNKQPNDLECILRPVDESLSVFAQTWETKLESILDCTSEIIADASVQMAKEGGHNATNSRTGIFTNALLRSVMSRCNPFMTEYETLSRTMADKNHDLATDGSGAEQIRYYEIPKLSGLPSPVLSFLDGLQISDPGILMNVSQGTRERHFRNELKQKASEPLKKVLDELKPRLRHWFRETIRELKDSYHAQTDPLRYRDQGQRSDMSDDVVRSDIEILKIEGNGNSPDSQEAALKANPA
jgi:GTP-binding protein EngB required for normal cell division